MPTLVPTRSDAVEVRIPTEAPQARDPRVLAAGTDRISARELDDALEHAAAGRLSRVESELARISTDDLRPGGLIVGVLFVVFAFHHWFALPPGVRGPVCVYDVGLIVLGLGLYAAPLRVSLSARAASVAAAMLSFAVLGNIMLSSLLHASPVFSFYVAVLLIASAGSMLSLAWGIAIASVDVAGWAIVARLTLSSDTFVVHAFVMVSSIAVAFMIHVGRHRARSRIMQLRAGDARRELALQEALAEADEARRGLDRKVEERTAALRSELEERERLEAQLRHAQKIEAVGRLAGGIAHDFNNLLTVIRMSHVTLVEPGVSAEDQQEAMRDASDATDRAAALTHDLLAFARKQTLERTTVAVGDILGGVQRMVRRVAEATVRVELRISADVGDVVADRHQIEQVLLNLAINACDAMGNRGTLALVARAVELAGAEAARYRLPPGWYVCIAVSDTGTGMDEATKRAAFEPFFTTKEVGRGTGLGLAVAHGIVTQHGGQIDIETELGKGSTFTVFLPRARGEAARSVVAAAKPLASLTRETLLVVEDEAAVRRAVQRNLERLGYHVLVAHDGEEALRLATTVNTIDLVLSDVVMPGIDGPELACRLRSRARWTDLPVLFVTGYSADRLARTDAMGPHDRVLEKPYQLEELARMIQVMVTARPSASTGPGA